MRGEADAPTTDPSLRRVDDVALEPLPFVEDEPAKAHLVRDGRRIGPVVRGIVLEAAVETPAGLLVFATDDVPFEEGLNLTLVSPSGEILDEAWAGAWYVTGVFRDLQLLEGARLRFAFFGDPGYEVEVRERSVFGLPWWAGVRGMGRPFTMRRHLLFTDLPPERDRVPA